MPRPLSYSYLIVVFEENSSTQMRPQAVGDIMEVDDILLLFQPLHIWSLVFVLTAIQAMRQQLSSQIPRQARYWPREILIIAYYIILTVE